MIQSIAASDSREALKSVASGDETFDRVRIDGDVVRLDNFCIRHAELARHLADMPAPEKFDELIRIVAVGLVCVQQVQARNDTAVVEKAIQHMLDSVLPQLSGLPGVVKEKLLNELGTGDGKALKPVKDQIDIVHAATKKMVDDTKQFVVEQLDPRRSDSPLGQTIAAVSAKLDPTRVGSIQHTLEQAVKNVTAEGGALARTVKDTVAEALKPLKDQVDALGNQIRKDETIAAIVDQTTLKGVPFEERVVQDLQLSLKAIGAVVEYTGADNKPGDILVSTSNSSVAYAGAKIVIETRDQQTPKARKAVSDDLSKAMTQRGANAAIYLSKTSGGFGKEIGDWAEGLDERGPWVATTYEHLQTAIRLLLTLHRLQTMQAEAPEFDGAVVESQMTRIRTSLKRITNINTKSKTAKDAVDSIMGDAESLRDEIRDALNAIEDVLRKANAGNN